MPDALGSPCLSADVGLLLTSMAAGIAWYAVASVNISGLLAANFTAADVIREHSPFHLIRPERLADKQQAGITGRCRK
jgi:hypothetical protein